MCRIVDLNRHYRRSILDDNLIDGFTFTPQVSSVTITGPYNGARRHGHAQPQQDFRLPSRRRRARDCRARSKILDGARAQGVSPAVTDAGYRNAAELLPDRPQRRQISKTESNGRCSSSWRIRNSCSAPKTAPASVKPGQAYRISDLELASRLSFFLWSTGPDDELIDLASQGKLKDPAVLEQQVRRMLADPRSHELVEELRRTVAAACARCRARLRKASSIPISTTTCARPSAPKTEMFFDSIMREDRSVDRSAERRLHVRQRAPGARTTAFPNIYGSQFRRVTLDGGSRRAPRPAGQGQRRAGDSISDRTSPVQRGKWVLTNIPGRRSARPAAERSGAEAEADDGGAEQTMRQRMEEHRANPACASCHKMMDPIGFALENFDGIGKWRTHGARAEAGCVGPAGRWHEDRTASSTCARRWCAIRRSSCATVTEKLLTYALGRGVEYDDMPCSVRSCAKPAKNNYKFSSLVLGIVKSEPFQMNRKADSAQAA